MSTKGSIRFLQAVKKGPNDFIFGRVLGEGSFSTVHLFYLFMPLNQLHDIIFFYNLQVYLAKDIQTEKEFASKLDTIVSFRLHLYFCFYIFLVKVCEKRHIIREKKQQYVKREKEVLMLLSDKLKLSAPFFVKLFCTFHDQERLC